MHHFYLLYLSGLLLVSSLMTSQELDRDTLLMDFVGGGDIQRLSQDVENNSVANLSFGVHFQRIFKDNPVFKNIDLDIAFNVATTADSLGINTNDVREFGSYVLNPINSRQSARFDMYSLLQEKYTSNFLIDGFYFKFHASNKFISNARTSSNFSTIHFRIGLFHEFIPDAIAMKEKMSVMLGFGYSSRGIYGDINMDDKEKLEELLEVKRSRFRGFEAFFGVRFDNLRAEVTLPFIPNKDESVAGLTGTQPIISIRFVGGFSIIQ